MKVSIVTEGFQSTGYGHITRCLSLYQAFAERSIYPTLYINGDEKVKDFLEVADYKLLNWINHPAQLTKQINNSDILIIDSYLAGKDFYDNIVKFCNIPLFIDDNIRIEYPNGIILNGTINAENFAYPNKNEYSFLLGSNYIPIRKEFWDLDKRKINQNTSSLLITFGGQDVRNLTIPVLNSINEIFPSMKKFIVFGNGFNEKALLEKERNVEVYSSLPAVKMKELMLSSDIVVTAAGQTLYELAATGTPSIAVAVADNQKNNIIEWKKSGFLIDPIFFGDINLFRKINEQIESMTSIRVRKKLSSIGKKNVDGQGSRRVVKYLIEKICYDKNFYLRKAVISDSQIVLNLSNDVSVRSQSINKNPISLEDHEKWFSNRIKDKNYIFLLAFDKNDNFIGQIRFQVENNSAIVSISITTKFRGKGLSKKILKTACIKVFAERADVSYITAYILPSNETSIKAFKSIGYKFEKEELINNETFLRFILNRE